MLRTKSIIDDTTFYEYYESFDFYDIVSGSKSTNNDETDILDLGNSNNDYNIFSDELFDGEIYPLKFKIFGGHHQECCLVMKKILNLSMTFLL